MSVNREVAAIFSEMAAAMELLGANPFKIAAFEKVARAVKALPADLASYRDRPEALTAIENVGKSSAEKIAEYLATGRIKDHEELLGKVPSGLLEVMRIPGLGPKTVRVLWKDGGITDLDGLRQAIESGAIEDLPRMGKKTAENLKASIAFMERAGDRERIGNVMWVADRIVGTLREVSPQDRVEYAGSLRRGRETIGDVDVVATNEEAAALAKAFTEQPEVERVLASGKTKCSVRLHSGVQVDLRLVPRESFGAALLYFTGSKAHNVRLRERAIKRGLRLNEYGVFPGDGPGEKHETPPQERGIQPLASMTEEAVYEALGLPWIPPELREDWGELDRPLPRLIELGDIKAELHSHTVASDGRLTIEAMAEEAKRRGFHTLAITDHSRSSAQAGGLSPERLRAHVEAIREANERVEGITLLAGSEVDILADGRLDYEDDLLAELDVVVASPHSALTQDASKATARLLKAVRHPLVHVLGHPTGRLVNARRGLEPDVEALIEAAVEHDTALEINANYHRLDLRDTHVRAAVEAGAKLAINTDAHGAADFDMLRYGVLTARRGWVTAASCLNAWDAARLHAWLKSKR